VKVIITSP